MTETQAIQIAYRRWQSSTDYPESSSDDYSLIQGALNDGIEAWGGRAKEESVKWRELFTNLAVASDGDKTTTSGTSAYDAPSNFESISSFVKVTDSDGLSIYYPYKKSDDVLRALKENTSEQFFYITGDDGNGYQINLNPTPTSTGNTISYSYYKKPTLLTTTSSVIEMAKPYFAIYFALSVLNEEERPDLAQAYATKAASIMDQMIIDNEIPPFNHPYKLGDFDYDVNGGIAFGRP